MATNGNTLLFDLFKISADRLFSYIQFTTELTDIDLAILPEALNDLLLSNASIVTLP